MPTGVTEEDNSPTFASLAGPARRPCLSVLVRVHLVENRRRTKVADIFLTREHATLQQFAPLRAYSVCCAALRVPTAQSRKTTTSLAHVSLRGVPPIWERLATVSETVSASSG
jgi:hypothetical protein